MASLHIPCLIFLIFHMVNVETAPGTTDKNIANRLVFKDNNNFESSSNVQNILNSLAQNPPIKIDDASLATIDKSSKTSNNLSYLDDIRQNWGIVVNDANVREDDEESYRRPINIPKPTSDNPVKPTTKTSIKELQTKPFSERTSAAAVDGNKKITVASENQKTVAKPTTCDVALIYCCLRNSKLEECFRGQGCFRQNISRNICREKEMYTTLQQLSDYYSLLQ